LILEISFGNLQQFHNEAEVQFRYAVARGNSELPECKHRRLDGISPHDGGFSY